VKIEALLRLKGHSVRTVQPWAPVSAAVTRLAGPPRIGALVVTGVERGFTGLLSERDIVTAFHRRGPSVLNQPVSEVMSRHVPTCGPEDNITAAMVKMTHTRYRHLPVLRDGELVGIVSIGDLVRARLEEMQLEAGVLRDLYWSTHARS
jgi:CBS domain-containing protein